MCKIILKIQCSYRSIILLHVKVGVHLCFLFNFLLKCNVAQLLSLVSTTSSRTYVGENFVGLFYALGCCMVDQLMCLSEKNKSIQEQTSPVLAHCIKISGFCVMVFDDLDL